MSIIRLSKYIKKQGHKISLALGDFVLTEKIGQGGNGLVYEATILGKKVAIKFLATYTTGKSRKGKVDRFLAEYFNIVTVEDLKGIVKYIDYDLLKITDEEGSLDIPAIIMKRYDCSLANQPVAVNSNMFNSLFNFLLDTVEKIHSNGIIHRDIKPENILCEGEKFILADFGIANYHPEIFHLRAVTEKDERLGNRLFSAPEQEDKDIVAHPTMDIYAIGQVLQWYVTGKTHRGTGRQNISHLISGCELEDRIIDKCLENNPKSRFQSIYDIRNFIKRNRSKNFFEYIRLFSKICRRNFPHNELKIVHVEEIDRIDELLNDFKENQAEFDDQFCWNDGSGTIDFNLLQKGKGAWKFGDTEYKIKEVWLHYDSSMFNDYILVHHHPHEPFIIDGKETSFTVIVDDKYHISMSECNNGYARIEGKSTNLEDHKVEQIERELEEGYFFIGTSYHCILDKRNDEIVTDFINQVRESAGIELIQFKSFNKEIRKHKHEKVMMNL